MQETTGEAEPNTSEDKRILQLKVSWLWWVAGIFYLWLILSTLYFYWRDDENFKLTIMHRTIILLQHIARTSGQLALQIEQEYNDYCQLLH
jgi:hypothetical protein